MKHLKPIRMAIKIRLYTCLASVWLLIELMDLVKHCWMSARLQTLDRGKGTES